MRDFVQERTALFVLPNILYQVTSHHTEQGTLVTANTGGDFFVQARYQTATQKVRAVTKSYNLVLAIDRPNRKR